MATQFRWNTITCQRWESEIMNSSTRLAVYAALGAATGVVASLVIYETALTWVPLVMIAMYVGAEWFRQRRSATPRTR